MPLDVQSTIYAKDLALLRGYAPFTTLVASGNLITSEEAQSDEREAAKVGAGDCPIVRVSVGEMTDGPRMTPFNDDPALMDMPWPLRVHMEFKIIHDVTTSLQQTPVEIALRAALIRRGRRLDIAWVSSSDLQGIGRRVERFGTTNRTVTRLRQVVSARPLRSLLIAT